MANLSVDTTDVVAEPATEIVELQPLSLEVPSPSLLGDATILQVAAESTTQDGETQASTTQTSEATLTGSDGQDILVGSAGDDRLVGGEGDDVLVGGGGSNVLDGGDGEDLFGHAAGAADIIADFAPNQGEKLALANGLSVSSSSQQVVSADLGTGQANHNAEVLTLSDDSTIALVGVTDQFSTDWLTSTT